MQYILGQCRCWIERNEKKKTETIVKMRPTYSFFFLFHNNWMNAIGGMEDSRKKTLDQGLLRMWLKHILWADIFSCLSSFRRRFHNKMCVSQICVRGFHHVFLFLICLFTCIHLWWMQAEKKCLGAKRIDGPGQFGLLRDFFFCSLFDLVAGRHEFFFLCSPIQLFLQISLWSLYRISCGSCIAVFYCPSSRWQRVICCCGPYPIDDDRNMCVLCKPLHWNVTSGSCLDNIQLLFCSNMGQKQCWNIWTSSTRTWCE